MAVECVEAESIRFSGRPLTLDFGDAFHSRGWPARVVIVCAVRSGTPPILVRRGTTCIHPYLHKNSPIGHDPLNTLQVGTAARSTAWCLRRSRDSVLLPGCAFCLMRMCRKGRKPMVSLRRIGLSLAMCLLLAGTAGSVMADKPTRGCSDDFELMSLLDFRALMNSAEFYESLPPEGQALAPDILAFINTDNWLAAGAAYDANADGQLCLKQKTFTAGHLWGWSWNAVDNTKNSS
jgi:hypothetical protein